MKKTLSLSIAAILTTGAASIAAPVAAQGQYNAPYSYNYDHRDDDYRRNDSRYDRYDQYENRRDYRRARYDRNQDRRDPYRNQYRDYRCDKGTGGTVIGAIAGGLAGREIAGRGDRTLGTIIGGAIGAIAGRAIDKSNDGCRR